MVTAPPKPTGGKEKQGEGERDRETEMMENEGTQLAT